MKRLLTLLLFFNTMLLLLQAQPMHQIKGTVIDKNSRQPLEFINVMIIGLNKGSVTMLKGVSPLNKCRRAFTACKHRQSDTRALRPPNTSYLPKT